MVRSRIRYELIADERVQKETFHKREKSLLKKACELKTLCNIDACAIIYRKDCAEPDVWPSQIEARQVISKFESLPIRNMMDQEGFLKKNISKLNDNLEKDTRENRKIEIEQLTIKCVVDEKIPDVGNSEDFKDMCLLLEEKLAVVCSKIQDLEQKMKPGSQKGKKKQFF